MDRTSSHTRTPCEADLPFSPKALPRSRLRHVGQMAIDRNRDGEPPLAVPASPLSLKAADRTRIRDRLAEKIRAIERSNSQLPTQRISGDDAWRQGAEPSGWTLGIPEIDNRLGPAGLDAGALHEIKPFAPASEETQDWAGGLAAALIFALKMTVRRLASLPESRSSQILWCWPAVLAHEIGRLHGPGLSDLGLDPGTLVVVEPDKAADVLWAMEEGLRAPGIALVAGALREVQLTPARRLSLAAAAHAVPCLLVTDQRSPVAGATATRWRIGRAPSAPHPLADWLGASPPGAPRFSLALERCRAGGLAAPAAPWTVEWSYATRRFRLASPVADRAHEEDRSRRLSR